MHKSFRARLGERARTAHWVAASLPYTALSSQQFSSCFENKERVGQKREKKDRKKWNLKFSLMSTI